VIDTDFESFMARYPHLRFDERARYKKSNPEVSIKLPTGYRVKFHHEPLDRVVERELSEQQ